MTNGRPRDPEVDSRITNAAIELFGEGGWRGVTMQKVAAKAGLSRATVYLRAQNRDELLEGVLRAMLEPISSIDEGSAEADLRKLANLLFDLYAGPGGAAVRRLIVEQPPNPLTAQRWTELKASLIKSARAIVVRGVERGDLPKCTDPTLLLDMLAGAVFNHANATPPEMQGEVYRTKDRYIRTLVEYILQPLARK